MSKIRAISLIAFFFLVQETICQVINQAAVWNYSDLIVAGNALVIDYNKTKPKFTNNQTSPDPSLTINFPRSFTSAPNLCYGIYYYEGKK